MNRTLVLSVLTLLLSANGVYAQESKEDSQTTTLKAEDIIPKEHKNQPSTGEDVDEIITNKKMRAESGSKSRWSIGSTLIYSGGSINSPLSDERPNLTGGAGVTTVSSLGGQVGVGYRLTTTDRLGVDIGVRWLTPTNSETPASSHGQSYSKFDASNPDVIYSKVYRWAGVVQSNLMVGPTLFTQTNLRKNGYLASMMVSQNNIVEIGHSGLSVGLYAVVDYTLFDQTNPTMAEQQDEYDIGLSPFLEYVINDRFNVRTVFNYANWEHDKNQPQNQWLHDQVAQSIGLGISVTRDIFLYPNIQFVPYDITHIFRADQTNVALQANINVF